MDTKEDAELNLDHVFSQIEEDYYKNNPGNEIAPASFAKSAECRVEEDREKVEAKRKRVEEDDDNIRSIEVQLKAIERLREQYGARLTALQVEYATSFDTEKKLKGEIRAIELARDKR
jgi:DNA repair ATPase RecN